MSEVISDGYKKLLMAKYEAIANWGASGHTWAGTVAAFALEIGAHSVLDYGCGRGTLKPALQRIAQEYDVSEYDPGIRGKDGTPLPADLVVATDVLEHIEPEALDVVLDQLKSLSMRGLFLNIATSPARELLPDGRNAHLIVEPPKWWLRRLAARGIPTDRTKIRKGLIVWAKAGDFR
jgi:hypothetical protein